MRLLVSRANRQDLSLDPVGSVVGSAFWPEPTSVFCPAPGSGLTTQGTFSLVQKATGGSSTPSAFSITLPSTPTPGNLVLVGIMAAYGSVTGLAVTDANGNSYDYTDHTPAGNSTSNCYSSIFAIIVPSGASKTLNVTWTSAAAGSVYGVAAEFACSTGSPAYDLDAGLNSATGYGTSLAGLSITPAAAGELLFAVAAVQGNISAPAAGASLGGWTGAGITSNGSAAEYILNGASGATAISFTDSTSSDKYSAIAVAWQAPTVYSPPSILLTSYAPTLTAGSGGASVSCPPPSGVSLAGKVCALVLAVSAVAPAGLHLTAKTPALSSKLAAPSPSALHLSALAPSKVMATRLNAPAPSALALSPKVPALSGRYSAPAPTALHITGNAPGKVMASRVSCPAPSSLSLSAYAPSDAFHASRLCPTPVALHTAVYAPALAARFSAASPATLHVTGLVAAKFTSTRLACPAPAAMALSPRAPKLHTSVAAPTPAAMHLTGLAPSVGGHFSVSCPAPSTLHAAGKIPSTHATTVCPSAHAALTGLVPRLGASVRAVTSSGLALQAFAPARQAAIAAPTAASLSLFGNAPHLRAGGLVTDPRYVVELPERGWSETLDIIPALILPARSFAGMLEAKVCSLDLAARIYEVSA